MDPRAPRAVDPEHWFHTDPNIYHGQVSGDTSTSLPSFGDESDEAVIGSLPFHSHSALDVRNACCRSALPAAASSDTCRYIRLHSLSLPSPARSETRLLISGAAASIDASCSAASSTACTPSLTTRDLARS